MSNWWFFAFDSEKLDSGGKCFDCHYLCNFSKISGFMQVINDTSPSCFSHVTSEIEKITT